MFAGTMFMLMKRPLGGSRSMACLSAGRTGERFLAPNAQDSSCEFSGTVDRYAACLQG